MYSCEEAHMIFRTGFFRNVHPLGCCKACYKEEESSNAAALVEIPHCIHGEEVASILQIPVHAHVPEFQKPVGSPEVPFSWAVSL